MSQQIHYEVFRRQGIGGFSLIEVRDQRDEAIAFAQSLMKNGATGVKVMKETFNEDTGDYLSLKVFEEGNTIVKKSKALLEEVPASPCFRPDDLYSYHARKTIATLLPDYLAHHKVTVIEFSHRADLLEKFEATGSLMQHAIQRVAVSQAANGEEQLHKIIHSLHELVIQAIKRVYKDTEKGHFPAVEPGGFLEFAGKLAANHEGQYLLYGTIARYLKRAKGWDEKVYRLMALMKEATGDSDGARLLRACIDALISEVLTGSAGLKQLIGAHENHGQSVMGLVKLFLGKEPDATEGCEGLAALSKEFKADTLPDSRGAVAARIIGEFKSFKRLHPSSLEEEFKMLRQIANLVVMGIGKYLSHEDLVDAFVLRSSRLVTGDVLAGYLAGALPADKLDRLLFVEENIIGAENKRALANFVMPVVTAAAFEEFFQSSKVPITTRLQQLESLRQGIVRSGFQENQRAEIADVIDRVAAAVESRGRLFDCIEAKAATAGEKVAQLLALLNSQSLTEPRLATRARTMVLANIAKPGFLASYMAASEMPERNVAFAELMKNLEQAGIPPEKSMRAIAA